MKLKFLLSFLLIFTCVWSVSSQTTETIHPPKVSTAKNISNAKKMTLQNSQPPVLLDPKTISTQQKWEIYLSQHGVNHGSDIPKNRRDSIKLEGKKLMHERDSLMQGQIEIERNDRDLMTVTPYVNTSFKGNKFDNWSPPDNNLAVSDDGFLVSVINSSVLFMDVAGNILMEEHFDDFLASLNLHGGYFDPKVLYDPVQDKFILVVLNGNTPATSTIGIAFSSSSNPTDPWWFYAFSGDPTGVNMWFDYPSIGISTDDIYISGNQYSEDGHYGQVLIYQLEKAPGFTGENITGVSYTDLRDANGLTDYNIVPMSYGFDGSVGPGIFMISTDGSGGDEATLYFTDNNSQNNPNIFAYSVSIPNYYQPFDGTMLGTTDNLNTNDCRTLSGFYANGIIHFAFDTRGDDFHTKIYYCRLNPGDLTTTSVKIGLTPFEYAYPAIAPFTTSETDQSILIGFLRTSSTIYPEIRMVVVDNDMNVDGSHMVKAGKSYQDFTVNTLERWGDYSGISRRHSATGAEVWISGGYGENYDNGASNVLSTWIAQITDSQANLPPTANFVANQTDITPGQTVEFSDHSTNFPNHWTWTFPGGTPSTSNQQNPVVTYTNEGVYDVTLQVNNDFGNDAELKTGYIVVSQSVQIPVADFTSDITSVATGGTVKFQDMSSNNPTKWQWFFPGGTPSLSGAQNPVVVYTEAGCHNVTLDAINDAGTDVITKPCYIDVLTAVSELDTMFNKFILYPNPVTNERLNVEFETQHPTELEFMIADEQGRVVKNLIHRVVKTGMNNLSFNTDLLSPGIYYLMINNGHTSSTKVEKFIVTR